jgi:hypothetical protein
MRLNSNWNRRGFLGTLGVIAGSLVQRWRHASYFLRRPRGLSLRCRR